MYNDDKLEALMNAKTGEEAFAAERIYFVKTDRMYNPRKTIPYKYFPGSLPVLVSAPHAVRHVRHKKIKPSDEFTGSMAFLLNKLTGCHAIAATKLYGGDPNFDDKCIYKEALKNLAREQKFHLVLDLHGASREHPFDVDIGTINNTSLLGKKEYKELLKKHLNRYGISKISDNHFSISGNNTITKYASSELELPAAQLEINKSFRVPHQNPGDYCRLIGALADFINVFA
ncbi:MAG TPA: hypothetical protein VNT57_01910 [Desulfobacteria bacterium]|nr:hypothetical protein [Desulfobacteria bacterium]